MNLADPKLVLRRALKFYKGLLPITPALVAELVAVSPVLAPEIEPLRAKGFRYSRQYQTFFDKPALRRRGGVLVLAWADYSVHRETQSFIQDILG